MVFWSFFSSLLCTGLIGLSFGVAKIVENCLPTCRLLLSIPVGIWKSGDLDVDETARAATRDGPQPKPVDIYVCWN